MAKISKEKHNTTDIIKVTFIYGLNVRLEKEKDKKINMQDLKKYDAKSIAIKLKHDLENLAWNNKIKGVNNEDSLLMTLTSKPDHPKIMANIKSKINAIDNRYKNFLEEIKLPVHDQFEHPQPATFEFNFYNNVFLKFLIK